MFSYRVENANINESTVLQISVFFSYEPLAHSQRSNDLRHIRNGGRLGLFDVPIGSRFYEDLQLLRPDSILGAPRLWNHLFSEYEQALDEALAAQPEESRPKVEAEVLERFRVLFGGRLEVVTTGGAPTGQAVLEFMKKVCFSYSYFLSLFSFPPPSLIVFSPCFFPFTRSLPGFPIPGLQM
jgi:long-subunit acyl-CoA synthetase (AMP-forming)